MELQEPEFKLSRLISVLLYLEIEPTQLLSLGTEPGGGGGHCHVWGIEGCATVKGMAFKQFTLGYGMQIKQFGSRIGYH